MGLLQEFREFALKGNVLDLAIGIVIGAAFGRIVESFVADILMPPLGLLAGQVDFSNLFVVLGPGAVPGPYPSVQAAKQAGAVTINYGLFATAVVTFTIVAFAVFLLVRSVNRLRRERPAAAEPEDIRLLREIRDALRAR